jgi:hypothetical protein
MSAVASRSSALFATLASPEVDAVLADAPLLELAADLVLPPADFEDACILVVEEGLAVIRSSLGKRGVVACHAGPGGLVLPPRDDEVLKTLTPTLTTVFTSEVRDRLFEVPGAARILFDALAATLRQKHRTIEALASVHHVDRVRAKLVQLARDHGRVGRDGVRLDFPLTHELLGEMTGSARETVTRAIDELQEEGFVVRRGRSYRIVVDPSELLA